MEQHLMHQMESDAGVENANSQQPLIHPNQLTIPIAILSIDDAIIVYANNAFRKIIQSTKVGEPIKGFLNTD